MFSAVAIRIIVAALRIKKSTGSRRRGEEMESVFPGEKANEVRVEFDGCGCACHPSAGPLGGNMPSVQVGR